MDSQRNGLLSTLLMTLPLIVVPAIALLRPPGAASGVSTSPLQADESDDLGDLTALFPDEDSDADRTGIRDPDKADDDSLFREVSAEHVAAPRRKDTSTAVDSMDFSDPFTRQSPNSSANPDHRSRPVTAGEVEPEADKGTSAEIEQQLNAQGALRTFWFDAGEQTPVGLAVFFRGATELTRIRFEAVGQSRDECARNVLGQVTRWQSEQTSRSQ